MHAMKGTEDVRKIEEMSKHFIDKLEQDKYDSVVNLLAKMIVDITLSEDDKESNPLPAVQQ
jgi:hypothetical protein